MNAMRQLTVWTQKLLTAAVALFLFLPVASFGASGVIDQYNNVSINIPDNTGSSVSAQVTTAGAPANAIITSVNIYSEVLHTYRGDLQLWATAYYNSGWHDYYILNRPFSGAGNDSGDNYAAWVNNIHTWDGASPNQTWYLSVKDFKTGDTGKLEFFQIQVSWVNSANISVDVRTSSNSRLSASEMNAVILFDSGGTEKDRKTNPSANPVVFSDALFGSYFVDVYCWDMLTKRYNFTHNSTSTSIAPQQDTQKRPLKVTAYCCVANRQFARRKVSGESELGRQPSWLSRTRRADQHSSGKQLSHQWETPLTLTRAWTESERAAHYFYIDVPTKTTDLTIQTTGGTGDTDLYVRYASRPTSTNSDGYDFKSVNVGNTESISIPSPQVGRWFIMLPTTTSYANIQLLARVTLDTNAPTVSITSPASGTTYTNAQSIPISANATDNVAVVRVEFFDGAILKSTDTTAPYSNYWTFTAADNGVHPWTARAYDAAGNVSTSGVVTLTVSIDATAPTVSISSPANGATLTTATTTVSGTASDPGSPASGLNLVQVRVNGGSWSNATGTTSWSRSVTLSPCGNTIEARSLDKAGNYSSNAAISVTYNAPNTVPSTPVNVSPTAGSTGLPLTPTLVASAFSDADCTGDTHAASQWQVLNSAGTVVVADSGTNTVSKVNWTVPAAKLNYGSNYVWRVRYQDSRNGWSSYSAQTAFTTGGPQLNGTRVGANIVLSWPTNASAFKLFYATNLPATTWISNPVAPPIMSGQYTITNSMTNNARFYRLKK